MADPSVSYPASLRVVLEKRMTVVHELMFVHVIADLFGMPSSEVQRDLDNLRLWGMPDG